MYTDGPTYFVHSYSFGGSFEFAMPQDNPCDSEMIERVCEIITPDSEYPPDAFPRWADIFFSEGRDLKLIGTWVVTQDELKIPKMTWYESGWPDRPTPSKEKSLRHLHQLDRPI